MRHFRVFSAVLLFALDCVPQYGQSSVSPVAFSVSQDVVPAFSSAGPITLLVSRQLIDIGYPNGKSERGDLLVVYDPQGGHHFWQYSAVHSPNEVGVSLSQLKSGGSAVYIAPDRLVEFTGAITVIEHTNNSTSLGNAESASIDEIQRSFPQARYRMMGLKTVPLNDAPTLVGLKGANTDTKALPTFSPIPLEFWCVPYGGPGQGPCPHGTLIVSISKQGDNWRLVLRNRWDVEVILDPSYNAVSSKQLTATPKQ